jgi:hypothetical protein
MNAGQRADADAGRAFVPYSRSLARFNGRASFMDDPLVGYFVPITKIRHQSWHSSWLPRTTRQSVRPLASLIGCCRACLPILPPISDTRPGRPPPSSTAQYYAIPCQATSLALAMSLDGMPKGLHCTRDLDAANMIFQFLKNIYPNPPVIMVVVNVPPSSHLRIGLSLEINFCFPSQ